MPTSQTLQRRRGGKRVHAGGCKVRVGSSPKPARQPPISTHSIPQPFHRYEITIRHPLPYPTLPPSSNILHLMIPGQPIDSIALKAAIAHVTPLRQEKKSIDGIL